MKQIISDAKLGGFILDCVRLTAKIECMTALDNLKLSLRKARKVMMGCAICGRAQEGVITCEVCGKRVCLDHITKQENAPDDFKYVCIDCLECEEEHEV